MNAEAMVVLVPAVIGLGLIGLGITMDRRATRLGTTQRTWTAGEVLAVIGAATTLVTALTALINEVRTAPRKERIDALQEQLDTAQAHLAEYQDSMKKLVTFEPSIWRKLPVLAMSNTTPHRLDDRALKGNCSGTENRYDGTGPALVTCDSGRIAVALLRETKILFVPDTVAR